jgi:hypothetical protein
MAKLPGGGQCWPQREKAKATRARTVTMLGRDPSGN